MIRSLDPDRRKKWPGLIGQLVFLYNCTPHGTTGLSPYRLLYGREPNTPLDQLIGNGNADWDEDFVSEHSKSLQQAHMLAQQNMEMIQNSEKMRHDALPMSSPLNIGARVLLKKCAFEGRHKLEDKVLRDPFIVTAVNEMGDVYKIRPMFGGPTKVVNRRLLIPDPREEIAIPTPQDKPEDRVKSQPLPTSENTTPYFTFLWEPSEPDRLTSGEERPVTLNQNGSCGENEPTGRNVPSEETNVAEDAIPQNEPLEDDRSRHDNMNHEVERRRSRRVNKGQHRNRLHLPVSVLPK
ncbi:uncharacterized protein LOC121429155 [Lytechinus variegatus]|uniref:uncharacterized protein LOC121429155 n=1 Tax=Lytechinus variegatus TaxID=7654 RepID=UPI001BB1D75F|nr:uncharacterized protein LOC121429155 [Lytechinus variegatus]